MFTDDELNEIYSNAPIAKDVFEVISISASWFSKKYYLQNMDNNNVEIVIETGETVIAEYVPMSISESANNGDMSYSKDLVIAYVNDTIAAEQDNRNPGSNEKIQIESRYYVVYRDGSISEMKGSVTRTEVNSITRNNSGAKISSTTRKVTVQTTGELFTIKRFPMMRGFL